MTINEVVIAAIVTIGCGVCAFIGYLWGRRDSWIANPEAALADMTLMRDMLLSQLESEGIEPVVLVNEETE